MQTKSVIPYLLHWVRYAYALMGTMAIVVVAFVVIDSFLFTEMRVAGISMEPTITSNQMVPVCLICARFEAPHLNSIVAIEYGSGQDIRFIKRVVATPGMTVTYQGQSLKLGSDQYFVEGDNRMYSTDSRAYGPITRSQIIGIVVGAYAYPPAGN